MRRVLMVSPHFPPDTGAATHRVRLLAPHLPKYGWEPTVVTVEPSGYQGRLDLELGNLVPNTLRVVRCRAWSARWTRRFGFGDLGLRAFSSLYRTCGELLTREKFDLLFITIFPAYPALLGPILRSRFGVPYVVDYQDPWVSAWGVHVGGGPKGEADLRSKASRWLATRLEPIALRGAGAITAVSEGTYDQIFKRIPELKSTPRAAIPVGAEPADFRYLQRHPRHNPFFDSADGMFHLCFVGTLAPLGFETLRALFEAVRLLRDRSPQLYSRLRLHFLGTSNQTSPESPCRVLPVANEFAVSECVTETPARIDYLDALTVQCQASAILLMGSSESHYTASRLYPALLAKRPVLAVFHCASSVVEVLRHSSTMAQIVTYDDEIRAEALSGRICEELVSAMSPGAAEPFLGVDSLGSFSAESLAGKLATVLDQVCPIRPLDGGAIPRVDLSRNLPSESERGGIQESWKQKENVS